MVTREPTGSAFKVSFIQCAACGAVVGAMEPLSISHAVTSLGTMLERIAKAVKA